jgi:glycosyltransferase involved in cell wall biosynthesis
MTSELIPIMLNLPLQIADKKTIVIIPVFNDVTTIRQVVEAFLTATPFTVIVVDDGSTTSINHALAGLPIIVLRHRVNMGQGAALQTGFVYARRLQPDIVVTFDADGQHSIDDLPEILAPIVNNEADAVLGSRFIQKSKLPIPPLRKTILQAARFINYLFSGILLSDAHNGLRAFNRTALEKMTITENRMAHASEVLFEISRHQLRYLEVPVSIHYTGYSREKGQSAWDSIKILFDILLHKLFR